MKIIRKKIDFNLSKNKFEYFLNYVNEKEKEKILKYRRYEDSLRSLYGKMILKDILNLSKVELEYNKWGKPKLLNNNKVHFNISHSGEWIAVGISSSPIGVDIQKVKKIDLSIAKSYFSQTENEFILSLPKNDRIDAFYMLWTLKEAFIKANGMGLYMALDSFAIDISNDKPRVYNDKNEKYQLSVERIEKDYFMATCILKD